MQKVSDMKKPAQAHSKKSRFSLIYLLIIGLISLIIIVLGIISIIRERRAIASLSMSSIQLEGERLATEVERRTWQLATECLKDADLRNFATRVTGEAAGNIAFGSKISEILKKHAIADGIFVLVDGKLSFPLLRSSGPYSPVDAISSKSSPDELKFASFFSEARNDVANGRYETAKSHLLNASELPVSNNLQAQALDLLSKSYMSLKEPTNAVRTLHRLENQFGDCLNASHVPYALAAVFELERLGLEKTSDIQGSLRRLYVDLVDGRWPISADVVQMLKSRLEKRLGPAVSVQEDTAFLRQFKMAPLVLDKLKVDTISGSVRTHTQNIFVGQTGNAVFYVVLPLKDQRRLLAITVRSERIAGSLLNECRANLDSPIVAVSAFQIKDRSSSEPSEMTIPFRTVFPFLELRLPKGASAAGKFAAKVQLGIVGASTILMICLVVMIADLLIRVSREQVLIQTRSDFLGHVSHELKTPLTLIQLYAETLMSEKDLSEEDRERSAKIIYRESGRLENLIENLLQLSRIERAQIQYKMEEGDLGPVIEKTAHVCIEWLEQEGLSASCTIAPDLPPVLFDHERVTQAFLNLIDNARKYAADSKSIEIRLLSEGSSVILEVQDHGAGIPASEQQKVFDQFYRGDNAAEQRGSGLGLFLVSETMKAHKGSVELESVVGKGSCFRLIFPASAVAAKPVFS